MIPSDYEEQEELEAIKKLCLCACEMGGGTEKPRKTNAVEECQHTLCSLYPFRMGTLPDGYRKDEGDRYLHNPGDI